MIVLPIENKLDWRRPPLVTLALIATNVIVFFACLTSDSAAIQRMYQLYAGNNLVAVEAPAYRAYHESQTNDEVVELPVNDEGLIDYIVWDLGFDGFLRRHPPGTIEWRRQRDAFEVARAEVSWIGYGLIPAEPRLVTFITSMYLHAGIWHLLGNMVFLFVFGFSLERAVGRLNYFALYHLTGIVAGLLSVAVQGDSYVPGVGASCAVSGLMGAYIAVYRLTKIRFFYNVLVYFGEFRAPALWVLPFWLAKELYGSWLGGDGVAYWAHIGGLLAGAAGGFSLSWLGGKHVDKDYLEENAKSAAQTAEKARLDNLVDGFKYDQAKSLARRMLDRDDVDVATWSIYVGLLRADTSEPDYHKAVLGLFALAPKALHNAVLTDFIEQTYVAYASGGHPKPVFKSVKTMFRLGVLFTRHDHLEPAKAIADTLIDSGSIDDDVKKLLNALANRLQAIGDARATVYRELAA